MLIINAFALKKTNGTYTTIAGSVEVSRSLYEERGGHGGSTIVPLENRLGLVNGHWTLVAAEAGCAFMASVPSKEAAHLLTQAGGMKPSASHLDRLPRHVQTVIDNDRIEIAERVRNADVFPSSDSVALIMVSLDGVMTPMKNAPRVAGLPKGGVGPKGHKESYCGTVSLFDHNGDRIHTIRFGRMPESKKYSLQQELKAELSHVLLRYPEAKLQAVADGAEENWRILREIASDLGITFENTLDYYHAMEYVSEAFNLAGGSDPKGDTKYWGEVLKDEQNGVESLIMAIESRVALAAGKTRDKMQKKLNYLVNHKDMMQYARLIESKQPIGSGVQEAACKTLVSQRMKNSGMTWSHAGGQAIITLRGYYQSGRWSSAWKVLRYEFQGGYQVDPDSSRAKPQKYAA